MEDLSNHVSLHLHKAFDAKGEAEKAPRHASSCWLPVIAVILICELRCHQRDATFQYSLRNHDHQDRSCCNKSRSNSKAGN
jgi:hypothetical protein